MNFNDYLNQAWSQHGDQPEQTAASLEEGLRLCSSSADLVSLVNLTTHLYSEHLHKFIEGERLLRELGKSAFAIGSPAEFAIARSVMAFRLCDGSIDPEADRLGLTPADLTRSLATATSALATRDSARALKCLHHALSLVPSLELAPENGVARSLAIAGNNTAASLEELPLQTPEQTELMLLAAETGRKYWEIAGTWIEVERAEYRWAKSALKAGDFLEARKHADLCLEIAEKNQAPALEIFFAYEARASIDAQETPSHGVRAEKNLQRAREFFEKLAIDDQIWARASLDALNAKFETVH